MTEKRALLIAAAAALVVFVTTLILGDWLLSVVAGVAIGFIMGTFFFDDWPKPPKRQTERAK